MIMSKKSDDLFHIYCDESRQTKHLYMMFGGIIVRYNDIPLLESTIQNWRENAKMYAELKWTKVSKGKLDDYKSLVDLFFSKASENKLAFKSAVFDISGRNKRHHGGDRELGFYKLMSEFL
jgi:hypothetical protein